MSSDKTVPMSRESFNVSEIYRGLAQRIAQFPNGRIESGIEVNESIVGPQFLP